MKLLISTLLVLLTLFMASSYTFADDRLLENYIKSYDYDARLDMKTNSKALIDLLEDGQAVLVDIRFKEEQQTWGPSFALQIPLNELPDRLNELPTDKIIVTACPHKDRAIIAMTYLRSKGIAARYLTDGLIGLAENLRGDSALYFLMSLEENSAK